ncbi:MAG: hypothetical protein Q7W45_01910 [Bacteroidota bacterium]|nr:hypothetical protein [Bacteroidota bacterium]MDP3146590.1 hypothetical protein [Bacteroidota bacterium]
MKKLTLAISSTVVAVTIIVACNKKNVTPTTNSTSTTVENSSSTSTANRLANTGNSFTNTELFEGIFYLKGPVVQEIPELVDLQNDMIQKTNSNPNISLTALHTKATDMVNKLNLNKPNFLNDFGNLIRSGDHQNVLAAVDNAIAVIDELDIDLGTPNFVEEGKKKRKLIIVRPAIIWQNKPFRASEDFVIDLNSSTIGKDQLVNSIVQSFQ